MKHAFALIAVIIGVGLPQVCAAQITEVEPPQPLTVKLTPNAARYSVRLEVKLSRPDDLHVAFYAVTGVEVVSKQYTRLTAGAHEFIMDVVDLAAGLYIVRVSSSKDVVTKGIVIVR